jgi:hypothetical protein
MFESSNRQSRIAIGATITVAIVISCLGIVRAQRFAVAEAGGRYNCSTGRACVEGNSTGMPYGVYGTSSGSNGVEGRSSATGRAGVSGLDLDNGIGVYAESHDTTGKYAALFARADESTTNIFFGYNRATNASCLIDPNANLLCKGIIEAGPSTNSVGVTGSSDQNYGVEGVSTNSDGVHGITSSTTEFAGVAGIATGTSGYANGVYGSSSNGDGVYGIASKGDGYAGVYGSASNTAIDGFGVEGVGGEDSIAVFAKATYLTSYIFVGVGSISGSQCVINDSASLVCTGTITGGGSQTRHRTSSGRHVLAYESESTSATIEDFGTARIVRGAADVQIEPTFASAIDRNDAYYVFLTPLGDTRGLYVSLKTPSGFEVRETEGGHSSLGFDYRIVAHPVDAGNGRLPQAPAIKIPTAPRTGIRRLLRHGSTGSP